MDVAVASKIGHALMRSLGGLSLAEGSMLLRLRRASIGLVGLVGAVGLGLVFFISQIGWPGVLSGPLPGPPTRVGTVHDAIAVTHPGVAIGAAKPAAEGSRPGVGNAAHRRGSSSPGSQLGHSKQLGSETGVQPGHDTSQPGSSQPAPAPEPATPSPSPVPPATPPVASSPPPSASEPVKTSLNSKASEAAVAKAVSDNNKSATATKSQGQKSTKDQGSSPASTKSSEASSAKAKRDESAAETKAKAPPPPPPASEKSTPAPNPAAAKEAADAAKANQAAH
jgi:hypothetical protein